MRRLMNYLRGMARLLVSGPFPERLMNLCAQQGVEFWGVEWPEAHVLRLTVRRKDLAELRRLAEKAGCQVEVEGRRGLPDFLLRFRSRYLFLIGLAFSLCAVAVLSHFVLTIQVTGNQRVPAAVILSQLRQLGVKPGVFGPALDRQQLAQEVMLGLEDLAWVGINLHGTRLEVIVRETIPTPEPVDESGYYDIVAEADGIITRVEAEQGQAVVQAGDTVLAGETLISGLVSIEPPQYSDVPVEYYQTHARGRVWARTWRTLTASIPVRAAVKDYTGEQKTTWTLELLGRRIEIFGNSSISWPLYDKITSVRQPFLPDGSALPIALRRETCRAYETRLTDVDLSAAQSLLEEQLSARLEQLLGEDGQAESVQFRARVENERLLVTLQGECREEIGQEQPAA